LCRSPGSRHLPDHLSHAVRAAVPAGTLTGFGLDASCWRTVDEELQAFMSFASALGLRSGPDDARVLVFTAPSLSLELEVMSARVVGQILPPGPGEVQVEASDGVTFQVEADEAGFFDLARVPSSPVRLRCETPDGRLVTDWVHL
jgi:hypothetical protein